MGALRYNECIAVELVHDDDDESDLETAGLVPGWPVGDAERVNLIPGFLQCASAVTSMCATRMHCSQPAHQSCTHIPSFQAPSPTCLHSARARWAGADVVMVRP